MMIPTVNSIWRYVGPGNGHNDVQRVISADDVEVVTISERSQMSFIEWSWLGPITDFPKLFKFVKIEHEA